MDSRLFEDLITPLGYFYRWEKEKPNKVFLKQPYGETWKTMTFAEVGRDARKMVAALRAMGLKKGDHIGIISKNCYHWIIADIAIMMGGYVSTPFYANLSAEQLSEVIPKSDTKAVFVGKLDHWDGIDKGIPEDMPIIKFPHYEGNAKVTRGVAWDDLLEKYEPVTENHEPNLNDMWTILFTSGTTGSPKGVIHDYENASLIVRNEVLNNSLKVITDPNPRFFSFLPLNHIAERTAVELSALMSGGSIAFAESLDTFGKNLQDIQPTLFFAVPRIWTKFYLAVLSKMPQKKLDRMLRIPIVSGMVKKKIKQSLGLTNATLVLTGASITPENLKQWYRKLGINLREVYGMTENFGGFTLMPEHGHKPNTVGKPVPNAEGRIDADTGEILMKMPWMMKGYYKEEEKTGEVLVDGWLHTGDKGLIDADGYFKIIGRVKDAFKTSKGKFIVPTELEDHFSDNDFIEQICVAGLGIAQPVALVNLSEIGLEESQEKVTERLESQLQEINTKLHGHERISTVIIAKEAWSPDNNLLTPTLKIRRGAIDECYMTKYEPWHSDKRRVIWED
ncbi:MAG: AMP-binding protein [Saprospiraceae bacterium]|nr:AMP-binding protein [Saprospiraceae bacterium]